MTALAACPADAAVLAVCLLAWCDPDSEPRRADVECATDRATRRPARRRQPSLARAQTRKVPRRNRRVRPPRRARRVVDVPRGRRVRAEGRNAGEKATPPRISFFDFIAIAAAMCAAAARPRRRRARLVRRVTRAPPSRSSEDFGRREGGGGGGDEEPGEESSSSPRERQRRRKAFAGGPAGASPNNKRRLARDAYSPEASPRASLDASLEPSEGRAADLPDAPRDRRVQGPEAGREEATWGPPGTAARAVRTRGARFLGKAFFLVRRGRSSLGDAFAFVSKADDNVAIPVACGAVAWAARGWLLGWT